MIDAVAWLFCPADRPERYAKAADRSDVVILDLEDGVLPADRPTARRALAASTLDPSRTVVRVNAAGTHDQVLDLVAIAAAGYEYVMLAKAETPAEVTALAPLRVVALCETPRGVLNAPALAEAPGVQALMWGAEDLVAAIGGHSSRFAGGAYRDVARHARSAVLLAAAAAGVAAVDAVFLDIGDLDGLATESADAAACGFAAKACIHPSQVATVRQAFRPDDERLDWARRVLAAAVSERGVFAFESAMVDEPVLRQARRLLAAGGNREFGEVERSG